MIWTKICLQNFHKLKEQFDVDYQKTIKILNKLDKFKSINERHLKVSITTWICLKKKKTIFTNKLNKIMIMQLMLFIII